jgi:hypothetical protein
MRPLIRALFIFILSAIWLYSPLYGKIPRRENNALQTLFNAAGGGNWLKRDNWKGAPGTENTWYGITCNSANTTILEIVLKNNRLTGTLPADLSDLSNLQTLVLSNNKLTGIDKDLGRLSKLTTLDLSNNRLTGPVPSWIGNLKNLKKLNLSYNRFTGGIPSWLGKLRNLEELLLDGNQLQGPIPEALGNLSKLTVLRVGHNRLTGNIPAAVSQLTRLYNKKSNFRWNGLYTGKEDLREFLKNKQAGEDWESSQTIAPGKIEAVSASNNSITLSWEAVAYTEESGGYRVFYSTTPGPPYKMVGTTDDKTISRMKVKELAKSTTYYFVVETWTDPHGSNRNRINSGYSKEISAATRGTTISGYVTTPAGQGVPGVKLTASDSGGTVVTNPTGSYNLGVLPGWSGTVTASKKGYDLSPTSKTYSDVKTDLDSENYTAEANTVISGKVTGSKGKGVPDVTLTFSDSEGKETTSTKTGSMGNYLHIVPYNWAGTATPSKDGYIFEPPKRGYAGTTSARPGNEYRASLLPKIGGRVKTRGGKGIPGVTLTVSSKEHLSGETFDTDKKGNYSKLFKKDWSGHVTPAKAGYKFYPAKRKYKNITLDTIKIKEHYKAEREFKFFVSVAGKYMLPASENFGEIYEKGVYYPAITAGYKFSRGIYIWSGYGFLSKSGIVPVFEEPSKWAQNFLSLGLGFFKNISITFALKAELGVSYIGFTEETFDETVTGSTVGVRIGAAWMFKVTDLLFSEISIHYLHASSTVNDISLKLGGLKAGIGLGLRF